MFDSNAADDVALRRRALQTALSTLEGSAQEATGKVNRQLLVRALVKFADLKCVEQCLEESGAASGDEVNYLDLVDWLYGPEVPAVDKTAARALGDALLAKLEDRSATPTREIVLMENESGSWQARDWTHDVRWKCTEPLAGPLASARFSCRWRDHGWGDGEGCVTMKLYDGAQLVFAETLFGMVGALRRCSGETEARPSTRIFSAGSPLINEAKPGDHLAFHVNVGGCGCELEIEEFSCIVEVYEPFADPFDRLSPAVASAQPRSPEDPDHVAELHQAFPFQGYIERTEERAITLPQLCAAVGFSTTRCHTWREGGSPAPLAGALNLYDMCKWVLRPATKAQDCAFVELLASQPQRPAWFASHWWGEPVVDFVRCLRKQQETRRLRDDTAYWVCAYANRQWSLACELAIDPGDTSFYRAIGLASGVLLVLDAEASRDGRVSGPATPFSRIWCCYEESVVEKLQRQDASRPFLFDIVAVHQSEAHLLTDGVAKEDIEKVSDTSSATFWKARREASFPLEVIQTGLQVDIVKAQASVEADRRHILNAIAGRGLEEEPLAESNRYDEVNRFLRAEFAVPAWAQAAERGAVENLGLPGVVSEDRSRTVLVLDLCGCPKVDDLGNINEAMSGLSKLQRLELDVGRTKVDGADILVLAEGIAKLSELETLSLGLDDCQGVSVANLRAVFHGSCLKKPRKLRLSMRGASWEGIDDLAAFLASSAGEVLQEFDLDLHGEQEMTAAGFNALAKGLAGCRTLRKCALCFGSSGDNFSLEEDLRGPAAAVAESVGKLATLTSLRLQFHRFGEVMFGPLADLPLLEELHLGRLTVSEGLERGLSRSGAGRPELRQLHFALIDHSPNNEVLRALGSAAQLQDARLALHGDVSGEALAEGLSKLTGLHKLSLRLTWVQFSAEFCESLAHGLSALSELETLSICFAYSSRGSLISLASLAPAIRRLSKLKRLSLDMDCSKTWKSEACVTGLSSLADALTSLQLLEHLELDFSACLQDSPQHQDDHIKDAGDGQEAHRQAVKRLAEAVAAGPHLSRLRVSLLDCFALPEEQRDVFTSKAAFLRSCEASLR